MQTNYYDGRMKLITGLSPELLSNELMVAANEASEIESLRVWQEEKDRVNNLSGHPNNRAGRRRAAREQRRSKKRK